MKDKIKNNALWLLGEFFIFVVPVISLVITACESRTSKVAMKLWGVVILVIITIVYYFLGKKKLNHKKENEYDKKGYVPTWLRVIGLFVAMLPFIAFILVLQSANDMITEVYTYIGITMGSIALGYIILIVDSYKKSKSVDNDDELI